MTFAIDAAFLPATSTCHPIPDDEFTALCNEHPDLDFEMTVEGEGPLQGFVLDLKFVWDPFAD